MKKKSVKKMKRLAQSFVAIRNTKDLALWSKTPAYQIELMAHQPHYNIFTIPKKSGGERWIEDPEDRLKDFQQKLNFYLQCCYHFVRTRAAYGFVMFPKKDDSPRTILTNAQQHLGCQYLYNADITDFFHQIKTEDVYKVFTNKPFHFDEKMADLLSRITTHQGRLPMGAPTSPTLSNFVCIDLDKALLTLSDWVSWTYTRYADDLSFSSQKMITKTEQNKITTLIEDFGFTLNPKKIKLYAPKEDKIITGLYLGKTVEIPKEYLSKLRREITKLAYTNELATQMNKQPKWLDKYTKRIAGKVAFVEQVMGTDDELTAALQQQLDDALDPPKAYESLSWLDFPYT